MGQVPDYEVLIRELLAGVAAGWSYDELTSWMTSQNLQEGDLAQWLRVHGAVLWLEDENRQQLLTVAGFGKGELARSIAEVSPQWKPALEEWEEWLKKGLEYYYSNLDIEAITYFEKILAIKQNNYRIWLKQGIALTNLGRHEEALISFDRAIQIKPDLYKVFARQGYIFLLLERHEEAVVSFDRAIEINPKYAEAWSFQGYALSKLEQYKEAITSYDQAIQIKPEYAQAWMGRGFVMGKLDNHQQAIESYERASDLKLECNEYAQVFCGKGWSLINLKKYEEAIESLDRAINLNPDYADAWSGRGFAYGYLEQYKESLYNFERALAINPNLEELGLVWSYHGVGLDKLGRYTEALTSQQRAIAINQESSTIWDNYGVSLEKLGRHKEALKCHQRAIELDPEYYNAWDNYGAVLQSFDRHEEALLSYQQAKNLNPLAHNAWLHHGVALRMLGQHTEALLSCQRAIDLKPTFDLAWDNQGVTLKELERYEEALVSFQSAIKINPRSDSAYNNLGILLLALNRYKEALINFQSAIEINPDSYIAWVNRGISISVLFSYQSEIDAYYEAFKHIHPDTHPKDYGYLQHHIGRAHYKEGQNQLLNKGKSPQSYYDLALSSYHKALETLTREKFPQLRLETLLDSIKVHLAQKDTDAVCERQQEAFDIFGDLRNAQPNIKAKKRLKLKYSSLRQFDVDLFIARGDNRRAIEAAELNKNEGLMLLLSALDEQTIQPNYEQMKELLTSDSTSKTGIIYWHLSQDNLTTFILTTEDPEPLLWESDSSSEHPPQRAYQAQQFQTWLKEWDTQYRDYSTKKWTETDAHLSEEGKKDDRKNHPWRKNLSSSLNQLRQILEIDKICDRLPSNLTHLILIPHRDLHRFPLHTLFLATNKLTNLQGCSYLPSIQIGLNLHERNSLSSYAPLLNITDPKTEQPELAFARIESALVRHLHHPHTHFEGKSADLTTIKNALSQHHATFNFTGHAAYDPDNPEVSALACAGGLLTAQEIWEFDLSSYNLVNLAACETAITGGKPIFSDEYVGLSSAFLHARAANILGTLWQVDEVATTWFTIYFYQQLLAGTSPAVALTITQQWMRTVTWQNLADWLEKLSQLPLDSGIIEELYADRKIVLENEGIIVSGELIELSDPYYWAAFTLTGRG